MPHPSAAVVARRVPPALALLLAGAAQATPITPFNDALLTWHAPDNASFFDAQKDRQVQPAIGPLAAASAAHASSGDWGSVSGSAAADLAAGTLKSRAAVSFVAPPDPALYMQSNAKFGDGFRTTTAAGSQPFSWQPGTGAQFSMHVDGSISATDPLGGSGSPGAFLILALFQPGTLSPNQNILAGANLIRYYAYFLGNAEQNLLSCFEGSCVPVIPEASYGDVSGGVDIVQHIQPGGDFDWQVLLGVAGWQYAPGAYDFDFSHTVTVGYQGPAGATTQAVSGVFSNITAAPVPEPGSLALVLLGLGVLAGACRQPARG